MNAPFVSILRRHAKFVACALTACFLVSGARAQGEGGGGGGGRSGGVAGGGSSRYQPGSGRMAFDVPTFFPPLPPVLGSPLVPYNPTIGWPAPPWEVSEYLTDFFYPPLSARIVMNDLPRRLNARVEAYGAKKASLLKALREKLDSLKAAEAPTRSRELAAFAVTQAADLAALETEGDELRVDLTAGGFFHESVDWNFSRAWRLNEAAFRNATDGMVARLQVMRAAVYYQKGFTPAQRRLLKEIVMEIADAIERSTPEAPGSDVDAPASLDSNPVFYFSPETSRFRLPPGLPPAIRAKLSAYEARKSALKGELQETVSDKDSAIFSISRSRAADALAKKQEAELASLEELADEIRRDLEAIPEAFRRPDAPRLPPPILSRMTDWVRERRVMQDSIFFLVEEIKKKVHVERISYRRGAAAPADPAASPTAGRSRTLSITVAAEDETNDKLSAVRAMVDKHSSENRPRSAHLESERLEIRRDIARLVGDENFDNPAAINAIVDTAFESLDRIEEWAIYTDYRTAMFQVGLSPAQRRLLFDSAIRSLNLPLPTMDRSLRIMMQ